MPAPLQLAKDPLGRHLALKLLQLDALATAPLPAGTLTMIVPRHPQRFADVARLLDERGIPHLKLEFEEKMWTFDRLRNEVETFTESMLFD